MALTCGICDRPISGHAVTEFCFFADDIETIVLLGAADARTIRRRSAVKALLDGDRTLGKRRIAKALGYPAGTVADDLRVLNGHRRQQGRVTDPGRAGRVGQLRAEGWSYRRIAATLGCSLGTAHREQQRYLQALR